MESGKIKSDVKESVKEGRGRLRKFDEYVQKNGFFLGVYNEKGNSHLVLTEEIPEGKKQPSVFIFSWVNTSEDEVFLAPEGKTEVVVLPLTTDFSLMIDLTDAIPLFEKASEKLK